MPPQAGLESVGDARAARGALRRRDTTVANALRQANIPEPNPGQPQNDCDTPQPSSPAPWAVTPNNFFFFVICPPRLDLLAKYNENALPEASVDHKKKYCSEPCWDPAGFARQALDCLVSVRLGPRWGWPCCLAGQVAAQARVARGWLGVWLGRAWGSCASARYGRVAWLRWARWCRFVYLGGPGCLPTGPGRAGRGADRLKFAPEGLQSPAATELFFCP
jgi:hypothetical protein